MKYCHLLLIIFFSGEDHSKITTGSKSGTKSHFFDKFHRQNKMNKKDSTDSYMLHKQVTCYMLHIKCYMLHFTSYFSYVTCYFSNVICYIPMLHVTC